ncbi:hypothetical protein ACFLYH_00545 [Candidatus Dependentiae bacterium]
MKKKFLMIIFFLYGCNLLSQNSFKIIDDFNPKILSADEDTLLNYEEKYALNLLSLIDQSYLGVREILLTEKLNIPEVDSYGKVFFDLQNIFSLTMDFYNCSEKHKIRKAVIKEFSDLAIYVFEKVNFDDIQKEYVDRKFYFWNKFISLDSEYKKDNFIIQSIDFLDSKEIIEIIKDFFLVLSRYIYQCLENLEQNIQDLMSFDFNGIQKKDKSRKKQTAAYIFNAISNICVQAGKIAGKPVQQGVLGIFGTIFNTASNIVAIQANREIEEQADQEIRSGFINKMLYHKLTQKILSVVFQVIQDYLHEKLGNFLDHLSDKLIDLMCSRENGSDISDIDNKFDK